MEYAINLKLTKDYFSEAFDQLMRYGSKWRKVEYFIGGIFLIVGITLMILTKAEILSPFILFAIALYELYLAPKINKIFWMRRQVKSKTTGTECEMKFNMEGMTYKGIYSNGFQSWEGIEKIIETPKSILMWPQKGCFLYLPKSLMSPEAIQLILEKKVEFGL